MTLEFEPSIECKIARERKRFLNKYIRKVMKLKLISGDRMKQLKQIKRVTTDEHGLELKKRGRSIWGIYGFVKGE